MANRVNVVVTIIRLLPVEDENAAAAAAAACADPTAAPSPSLAVDVPVILLLLLVFIVVLLWLWIRLYLVLQRKNSYRAPFSIPSPSKMMAEASLSLLVDGTTTTFSDGTATLLYY